MKMKIEVKGDSLEVVKPTPSETNRELIVDKVVSAYNALNWNHWFWIGIVVMVSFSLGIIYLLTRWVSQVYGSELSTYHPSFEGH